MTTLELVMPRLSEGRFASLGVLTDEALFEQTGIRIAFTNRLNGFSESPYDSLNLGSHVGDVKEVVDKNRKLLAESLGFKNRQIVVPNQVHKDTIVNLSRNTKEEDLALVQQGCDGLLLSDNSYTGLLCFADCMPVIIVSPTACCAIVHAGWRGVACEIAAQAITRLMKLDAENSHVTKPEDYSIYLGPHIHSCCFETSEELAEQFADQFGRSCVPKYRQVSLKQAQITSLLRIGCNPDRIVDAHICTSCNTDSYYSYRAEDGICGRHGAFAAIS